MVANEVEVLGRRDDSKDNDISQGDLDKHEEYISYKTEVGSIARSRYRCGGSDVRGGTRSLLSGRSR